MIPEDKGSKVRSFSIDVEAATKIATTVFSATVSLGALFYIYGFVIINGYFGTYGIKEYNPLKPACLSAGIVFIMIHLILYFIPAIVDALNYYLRILCFLVIQLLVLAFITDSISIFYEQKYIKYIVFYLACSGMAFWTIDNAYHNKRTTIRFKITSITVSFLILLVFMSYYWGVGIYPQIVSRYAGGKMNNIQIVISNKDNAELFTSIGINMNNYVTPSMMLLEETDAYLLVVKGDDQAVKIDKSLVSNILYIKQ